MKIQNKLLLKYAVPATLAALSFGTSINTGAQTPAPEAPASAPALPPNQGSVTPVQIYAAADVRRAFGFMDSNHDGQLSRAEAAGFKNVAKHFDAADVNKDGLLSPGEFEAALNGSRVQ